MRAGRPQAVLLRILLIEVIGGIACIALALYLPGRSMAPPLTPRRAQTAWSRARMTRSPGASRAQCALPRYQLRRHFHHPGQDVRHLRSRTGKGKPDCGLVETLGTFNPIRVAFHEWVGIWRDITQAGLSVRAADIRHRPTGPEP